MCRFVVRSNLQLALNVVLIIIYMVSNIMTIMLVDLSTIDVKNIFYMHEEEFINLLAFNVTLSRLFHNVHIILNNNCKSLIKIYT